ncbi:gliding motility-associated C-terminal domain-containing protein [Capnocytophaga canimorsus]|uniref:gliding motility-associated C-terminal domain-containing protein n=1 Tax=Capnocytophaga canimorsus TaxID=28188 RepID=UPI0038596E1A
MYRHNKHIVSLLLWLCLWLSGLWGNLSAQNKVWVGQTTTLSVSDVPNSTYTWELYVPTPNVDFAKISGNCPPSKAVFTGGNTSAQVQVQWLEAGTYYYKVSVSSGCATNTKIGVITVAENIAPPKISITYDCHRGTALLQATDFSGALLWSTGETSASIVVDTQNIPQGNTLSYWVEQMVDGVKSPRTEVAIQRNTIPTTPNTSAFPMRIYAGESVSLASVSCGSDKVQWFTDAALTQEITADEVRPTENTTYYVVCKTPNDCQSNAVSLLLEVVRKNPCDDLFENMVIPTGFSPNEDGVNDTWEVQDLKKYYESCKQQNVVRIFNRWGVKVYEKDNYMLDNQRFKGFSQHGRTVSKKPLPNGTYFFVITFEDGKQKTGYLYMSKDSEFDL